MTRLKLGHLLGLFLWLSTLTYANANASDAAREERNSYNQLAMSYATLREGIGAEAVKRHVLERVDLGRLPESTRRRYRRLISLANEVAAAKASMQNSIDRIRSEEQARDRRAAIGLLTKLAVSPADGGLSLLLGVLPAAEELLVPSRRVVSNVEARLRKEFSEFEFGLSEWRGALVQTAAVEPIGLVAVSGFRKYLRLATDGTVQPMERYRRLQALLSRNPGMYPAAAELALWSAFVQQDAEAATRYAQQVFAYVPTAVNRSHARAAAYAALAVAAGENGAYRRALELVEKGLHEAPNREYLLAAGLAAAIELDDFDRAEAYAEHLIAVDPEEPEWRFMQAALLADSGQIEAAIESSAAALARGYSEIASFGLESFRLLHASPRFAELTEMHLEFDHRWNILTSDEAAIKNASPFLWTDVSILPLFKFVGHDGVYRATESKVGYQWDSIGPGEFVSFNVYNSTKKQVEWLQLRIRSAQGHVTARFANDGSGRFSLVSVSKSRAWEWSK